MAVRRPPAPRLRHGAPGAPRPAAPRLVTTPTAARPAAPHAAAPATTAARSAVPRSAAPEPSGPSRRPVLLGAAALAVTAVPLGVIGVPRLHSTLVGGTSALDGAEEALIWATEAGALDSTTAAADTVDRGALARALHRAAGSPAVPAPAVDPAVDLGDDVDRRAALLWLLGRGALTVDADFAVHPERAVTRAEGAAALTHLLRPSLLALGVAATVPEGAVDPAVSWLDATGMIPSALRQDPADTAGTLTAGELAQVLRRSEEVVAEALA